MGDKQEQTREELSEHCKSLYAMNPKSIKRKVAAQKAREQQEWICLGAFTVFFCTIIYLYFRG